MTPELEKQIRAWCEGPRPGLLEGWCVTRKAIELAELVIASDARFIFELGVFGGRSFLPMAAACAAKGSGYCIGLDSWSAKAALESLDPEDSDDRRQIAWWGKVDLPGIRDGAARAIYAANLIPFCVLIQMPSEQFAPLVAPDSLDLLHIDGNHTVAASCRDVNIWLPKVRPGGHIAFDDAAWASTQPAQAILAASCDLSSDQIEGGSSWRIFRKR